MTANIVLAPATVQFTGYCRNTHIVNGRNLLSRFHEKTTNCRRYCVSESDIAFGAARRPVKADQNGARMAADCDGRWKCNRARGTCPGLLGGEIDPCELSALAIGGLCADRLRRLMDPRFRRRGIHQPVAAVVGVIRKTRGIPPVPERTAPLAPPAGKTMAGNVHLVPTG